LQSSNDTILGECREQGINVTNFSGVKKWWKSCEPTDEEAELMYDILYGWFKKNKRWLFQLEEAIMTLENWEYTPESILQAKESKRANGKTLKGCVAQFIAYEFIAYVKVDLVNQIHDSGVKKHGMSITKSRPKEAMLKMESDGKYVWRKKGQVFLSEVMHKVEKKTHVSPKQDFQKDNNNNANEENEKKNNTTISGTNGNGT
jgi:hypothetical protein